MHRPSFSTPQQQQQRRVLLLIIAACALVFVLGYAYLWSAYYDAFASFASVMSSGGRDGSAFSRQLPPLTKAGERMPKDDCLRVVIGIFATSESNIEEHFAEWLPLFDYANFGLHHQQHAHHDHDEDVHAHHQHAAADGSSSRTAYRVPECGLNFVFVYGEPATPGPGRVVLHGMKENMNEGKSFRWFHDAATLLFPRADYIFKMDTDIGICPPTLLAMLRDAAVRGAHFIGWPHTFESCGGKDYCPPKGGGGWRYMSGGFYGMARDVAARVARMNTVEGAVGIEDLLMGQMVYRAVEGPDAVPAAQSEQLRRGERRYYAPHGAFTQQKVVVFATECMVQRDDRDGSPIIDPLDDCPVKHFASHHPLKRLPMIGPMCGRVESDEIDAATAATTTAGDRLAKASTTLDPAFVRRQTVDKNAPRVRYTVEVFMNGRLGNQMFQFAAALGIAQQVRMKGTACIRTEENYSEPVLQRYFRGPFLAPCPPRAVMPPSNPRGREFPARLLTYQFPRQNHAFDVTESGYAVADPRLVREAPLRFPSMDVHVRTFLQSWRYFHAVAAEVRGAFRIRDAAVGAAAQKVLRAAVAAMRLRKRQFESNGGRAASSSSSSSSKPGPSSAAEDGDADVPFVTVGIHVRRGDYLSSKDPYVRFPPPSYFSRAMQYMEHRFRNERPVDEAAAAAEGEEEEDAAQGNNSNNKNQAHAEAAKQRAEDRQRDRMLVERRIREEEGFRRQHREEAAALQEDEKLLHDEMIEAEQAALQEDAKANPNNNNNRRGGAQPLRRQVLYVVASDDVAWCKSLPIFKKAIERGRMIILDNTASEAAAASIPPWLLDFAILTQCTGGTILTMGTFGWWAAYLGEGRANVVYYGDVFDMDHEVNRGGKVNPDDHFPPWWVPL